MTLALVAPVQPGLPPSCHWTLVQWLKTFAMSHRRTRSRLHRRTTRGSAPTEESLIGLLREAEDAVVAAADGAAAVAVAGGEVDGAVGAVLHFAQAAKFADEEGLGVEDAARVCGVETHAHETLADQAGEEEVALQRGELRAGDEGRAGWGDGGREFQQRRDHPFARHLVVDDGPAVILSLLDDVDFVAAAGAVEPGGAVLGLELQTRPRLPVQTLRVSMAVGEDGRTREGIAGGDR